MNSPIVTFCTPAYNRPEYLRRTIQSCLAQTYQNFEIVITDNSTNEESAKVVKSIHDPRIRYYHNDGNLGPVGSCTRAVSLAQGKYVQILMDDDLIKPRFLELMVDVFERNPTVGVVMAPMALIDENDTRIFPRFYLIQKKEYRYRYQLGDGLVERKRVLRDFLTGAAGDYPCCVPSGILYRAEALKLTWPFDAKADFAGDVQMCLKMAPYWDFYYIDEVLSAWRYTPTNHTARLHQKGLEITAFYYITNQCLANPAVQEMFRNEWEAFRQKSMFFCTSRAAILNGLAAVRARSPKLLCETVTTIFREDPYLTNFLRLPFWVLGQAFASIFPPTLPRARE
jgi:glycosyltransferase involved in cell wall biosynthesis